MTQNPRLSDKSCSILQAIDLAALLSHNTDTSKQQLSATRESISEVLWNFLISQDITDDRISVVDGFFFVFNEPRFARWHLLSWWEQRKYTESIKDNNIYTGRANALLARSHLAPYISYSDDMVAKSTDLEVKRAWMRKRLVLKECFWNAIDSFSHAAYF